MAAALRRFLRLRSVKDLRKKPSTSELIDWLAALRLAGIDPKKLDALPFAGVLLKDESDRARADDDNQREDRRNRFKGWS